MEREGGSASPTPSTLHAAVPTTLPPISAALDTSPPPPPQTRPGISFARTGASFNLSDARDPLSKLSVSFAFAQSARLSALEQMLETLVEEVRCKPPPYPQPNPALPRQRPCPRS